MPRKSSSRRGGRSGSNSLRGGANIVTIRGSAYVALATTAGGLVNSPLVPSTIGTNLGLIADEFLEYRFTKLSFTSAQPRPGYDVFTAIAIPVLQTNPTITQVGEMERAFYWPATNVMKLRWTIPKSHLLSSQLNWYRVGVYSLVDDNFEYQGAIVGGGLTPSNYWYTQIEYVCEFRGKASAAVTSERSRGRLIEELKAKATPEESSLVDSLIEVLSRTRVEAQDEPDFYAPHPIEVKEMPPVSWSEIDAQSESARSQNSIRPVPRLNATSSSASVTSSAPKTSKPNLVPRRV